MADIIRKVDTNIKSQKRYQYWASGAHGATISQGDIFKITESLGRPAGYLWIETSSTCDLEIRLNSQVEITPAIPTSATWPSNIPGVPDINSVVTYTDSTMTAIPIGANEVWEITNVLSIADVQVCVWSTGTFELLVA